MIMAGACASGSDDGALFSTLQMYNTIQRISSTMDGHILIEYNGYIARYQYENKQYKQLCNLEPTILPHARSLITPHDGTIIQSKNIRAGRTWLLYPHHRTRTWLFDQNMSPKTTHEASHGELLCASDQRIVYQYTSNSLTVTYITLNKIHEVTLGGDIHSAAIHPVSQEVATVVVYRAASPVYCVLTILDRKGNVNRERQLHSLSRVCCCCAECIVLRDIHNSTLYLHSWSEGQPSHELTTRTLGLSPDDVISDVACCYDASGSLVLHAVVSKREDQPERVLPYTVPSEILESFHVLEPVHVVEGADQGDVG